MHSIQALYELGINQQSRVLFILPHPDDEAVFASGWIQRLVATRIAVKVAVCTRGEKSSLRHGLSNTVDLATARYQEQVAAFAVLGVKDYEIWDLPDGKLEQCRQKLRRLVQSTIKHYAPTDIFVLEPDGVYGHPDHIAVTAIVQNSRLTQTSLWYLTVAPWHQHSSARAMAKKAIIQPMIPDYRLWLSASEIIGKYRALTAHRSQFQLLPWQGNTFFHFWKNSLWWSEFLARG